MRPMIRAFNIVVAVLFLGAPFAAEAQAVHTVGVLMPQRLEQYPAYPAFLETLRRLGYQEDGNLRILLRSANGKLDRLPALATELVEARPGGNVTGISNMVAELAPKRLALLKEAVPAANRIAVMFNPEDPINVPQMRDAERAAPKLKGEIRFFP